MKKAVFLLLAFVLVGCGGGSDEKSAKRIARKPRKILTEAEKEKYITPTIYYVADYSAVSTSQCAETRELNLKKSKDNVAKVSVCKQVLKGCALQGSCYISFEGKKTLINYHKKVNDVIQFVLVNQSVCRHGMGDSSDGKQSFKQMCLDPFYSVAADTSIYPLGTVVYISSIAGTKLPDGSVHDGYFIVRDSGGNIDGRGRFDFFTGDLGLNARNPFSNLGLGGESNFAYHLVAGDEAELVKSRRAFPFLKK